MNKGSYNQFARILILSFIMMSLNYLHADWAIGPNGCMEIDFGKEARPKDIVIYEHYYTCHNHWQYLGKYKFSEFSSGRFLVYGG